MNDTMGWPLSEREQRRQVEALKRRVWTLSDVPEHAKPPSMLGQYERKLLYYLASEYYQGVGSIVDAGCFLGGSTAALAAGLEVFLREHRMSRSARLHSYDRFAVEAWTIDLYFPPETKAGESIRHIYDTNVLRYADLIEVHAGDIQAHPWSGGQIEILFIDCAKTPTVCDFITKRFFAALIPGHSIVIQQDYLYHTWTAWLQVTMEYYSDYFEIVTDTTRNSVAFLYTTKIPDDQLLPNTVGHLSFNEQRCLMDRAGARFSGEQREILRKAADEYLNLLRSWSAPSRTPGE